MKTLALAAIRCYQRQFSALRPPACRFQPTCSQFTYEAIEAYGILRGAALGLWRILRCNPLNDGGVDPVPEPRPHDSGQPGDRPSRA